VSEFVYLNARHRRRVQRALDEVARLRRWDEFTRRYAEACAGTPHGRRTALRLELGMEMGMDDRETLRALYGN